MSGERHEGIKVGIPMPKLSDIPFLISFAARLAIFNLTSSSLEDEGTFAPDTFLNFGLSIFF